MSWYYSHIGPWVAKVIFAALILWILWAFLWPDGGGDRKLTWREWRRKRITDKYWSLQHRIQREEQEEERGQN